MVLKLPPWRICRQKSASDAWPSDWPGTWPATCASAGADGSSRVAAVTAMASSAMASATPPTSVEMRDFRMGAWFLATVARDRNSAAGGGRGSAWTVASSSACDGAPP